MPRSTTGRAGALALVVAGSVVLAACSQPATGATSIAGRPSSAALGVAAPAAPAAPAPSPLASALVDRRVFVEGDSLTVGVSTYLSGLLELDGWPVTVDAQVGRTTSEGIAELQQHTWEVGGTLVVALGTNDLPDPVTFVAHVDQVMSIASGRRVIWVTVAREGWDQLDQALLAAQARWANLRVIDWRPVIAVHPEMRARDGIHLTLAGYALRAEFIANAVETQA